MKKFTIFAGVNGAGKSTLYNISKVGNSNLGIRINTDEIVREIGDWKNPGDQIKAARKAIEIRNNCLKLDISFNQETTLTGKSILNTIKLAKEKGFKIYLNYVGIESSQLAKERIKNRVSKGGHNIPDEVVEKRYDESLKNLKSIIRTIDEIVIYDNTKEFQPIMTIKNGKILDKEKLIPEWIKFIEKDLSNEKNKEESLEKKLFKILENDSKFFEQLPPYNGITGKNFSINNSIELLVEQLDKNYKTNAWISEKELLKKQLMIKENEKPKEIVVYIQREAIFRKNIKVYNIDQLKISKDQERLFRAPEKYSKTNLKEIDIYSLKKELIKGSLIDFFIKEIKKEKLREKTKGKKIEIER